MTKSAAQERIIKLRKLIDDYRYHYHVLDESIMTEAASDSLKHELTSLEQQYPELITPDSPTQRVAGEISEQFKSIAHQSRMLSLNDVFSFSEIHAWQARIAKLMDSDKNLSYFLDIKMDGLACSLIYQDGQLSLGVTRGDGLAGEDVTSNIKTIESIPLSLRDSKQYQALLRGRTEVRGEIVMFKKDFEELNREQKSKGLKLFANPRNTAAGTIRQLDSRLVQKRKLHFIAYDLIKDDQALATNHQVYQALQAIGFRINDISKVALDLDQIEEYINYWEDRRKELVFNTDGVVIKVDDRAAFQELGIVGKAPRGAVAYKYSAEEATTKLKDIFISIGRTGVATPVAMLEPVRLAGSTVQMATLHNESEILRKDIRVNDTVIVHKAGDIIPEIIKPLIELRDGSEKAFKMPKYCPDCRKPLLKLDDKDAAYRCSNKACPSRTYKRIVHYASKSALNIEGLGEKNVITLIDNNLIKDQADIYALEASQIAQLERFGELSASNLITAINDARAPKLANFIYGLGIRHVGEQTAIDLVNHFKTLDKLRAAINAELVEIEGIGEVVAESVVEWFADPDNLKLLDKFKDLKVIPKEPEALVDQSLKSLSFVITGSLIGIDRVQAAEQIRKRGGNFHSSVTKKTDYLVVGENVGGNKIKEAQKLNIKVISQAQFLKMIGHEASISN